MNNNVKYLSVNALNRYIEAKVKSDIHLQRVFIKGEISNFKTSGGHYYFSLKDDNSEISAIMWQNYTRSLKFIPQDGMNVLIEAQVAVYAPRGTYSLHVYQMEQDGLGQLYLNFLQLKERLEKEGLFSDKYKRPLPKYPRSIAVITSATGDALNDIVSTINKRYPLVDIYLYPAIVQGPNAPKDLVRAIKKANLDAISDLIIIGRGGGSFEDLNCFNDEFLAREIFNSNIPIVSAVGHENDYTISDFVSDLRAPTPTGAAMLVTPNKADILVYINNMERLIYNKTNLYLNALNERLYTLKNSYVLINFHQIIYRKEQELHNLTEKLKMLSPLNLIIKHEQALMNFNHRLKNMKMIEKIESYEKEITSNIVNSYKYINGVLDNLSEKIDKDIEKLILLNPLNLLKKGYSIAYQDNKIINSLQRVDKEEPIKVVLSDGYLLADIIKQEEES